MLEPDGSPNTAHSMNPVPFVVTGDVGELREGGTLADVAPTVLNLLTGAARGDDRRVAHTPGVTFTVSARSGAARLGAHTPHGDVRTPAFVPLASTATVKSLHASEVAALGYDLVLGDTFHLFIQPGAELISELAVCTSSWACNQLMSCWPTSIPSSPTRATGGGAGEAPPGATRSRRRRVPRYPGISRTAMP